MKKTKSPVKLILNAALGITKLNVNSACAFHVHQPTLPESAKKLQNF